MHPFHLTVSALLVLMMFTAAPIAQGGNAGKRLLKTLDALAEPDTSRRTASDRNQANRREEERNLALVADLAPLMQAYYSAVAAGDEAAIFDQYSVERISGSQMLTTREHVLSAAHPVRQQIDAYGGLRRVSVLQVEERRTYVHGREAAVIVELEFNNGKRDASVWIDVVQEGTAVRASQWKMKAGLRSNVPAVGLFEIKALAEAFQHALMVEQDIERVMGLSGEGNARNIRKYIERMQQQADVNGGLETIDVIGNLDNMRFSLDSVFNARQNLLAGGIKVTYHYKNGKNSGLPRGMSFWFDVDNGIWKVSEF